MIKKFLIFCFFAICFEVNIAAQSSQTIYDFIYEDVHYKKVSDYEVEISPISVTFTPMGDLYQPTNATGAHNFPSSVSDTDGNWYQVIGIGEHALEGSEDVKCLFVDGLLNENLRYIGDYAFQNCNNMIIAEIPSSVKIVGENAFKGCNKLKYLALGVTGALSNFDNIMEIKDGAFCDTPELCSVFIGRMRFSLPQTDAFARDNYNSVHTVFFVDEPIDSRYDCFHSYACAKYGSFKDYVFQYNGLAPEFIPDFISNLPNEISVSVGNVDQIFNVNAGSGEVGCGVSFYIPYPYSLQFGVRLPCNYVIKRAPLHLNVKDCSRAYGEENPEFEIEVEGYVNGEGEEIFSTKPKVINGVAEWAPDLPTAKSTVGEYELIAFADLNYPQNYEISGSRHGTLTITPAPLEISAPTLTRPYGEENPEIALIYTGFKNNETEDALSAKPSIALDAMTDSPVGEYPIYVSGAEANNYEISYHQGALTITKAPQSIIWDQVFAPIEVGSTVVLNATTTSGEPVIYTSSNPDVADVEGNILIAKSAGSVNITAKNEGTDNYLASDPIVRAIEVNVSSSISDVLYDADFEFKIDDDTILLTGLTDNINETVYSIDGRIMYSGNKRIITLKSGIYILVVGRHAVKVVI